MPKLWDRTIEAHREAVREATIDAAATLVAQRGLRAVTMSEIAEGTGIGRATLYRYFPDVESILRAWHERQISAHLAHLEGVRAKADGALGQLNAVLEAYADIRHRMRRHHDGDLAAFLHRDVQVGRAERAIRTMLTNLLAEAARSGDVRDDIAPDELAAFALNALEAAGEAGSRDAVQRLVALTLRPLLARNVTSGTTRGRRPVAVRRREAGG